MEVRTTALENVSLENIINLLTSNEVHRLFYDC